MSVRTNLLSSSRRGCTFFFLGARPLFLLKNSCTREGQTADSIRRMKVEAVPTSHARFGERNLHSQNCLAVLQALMNPETNTINFGRKTLWKEEAVALVREKERKKPNENKKSCCIILTQIHANIHTDIYHTCMYAKGCPPPKKIT